jgi:3-oxoacyl-[acyl-carrier protein] reductase
MKNLIELRNKVILVTGATGGIGQEICLALAKQGAIPIIHYHSNKEKADLLQKEIKELGIDSLAFQADIRDEQQVKALVKSIKNKYLQLDGLVNNAGVLVRGFIVMQSLDKFKNTLDINLLGNFLILKHVCALMINQKHGSIVNISSAAGKGGLKGQSVYSSTKGALNSLTIVAAKEMAEFNIRVNAVSPGFISTGMLEKATEQDNKHKDIIPLKRFGNSSEVSSVVLFLLSNASSYMTGQNLLIDGGLLMS